jgi:hypothetical protein
MKIGIVVEGHGDAAAVRIIVRRLLSRHGTESVEIPQPWRLHKGKMKKPGELDRAVEMMARKTAPDGALLVVLDADDDCPAYLGPQLLQSVRRARQDRPAAVVVAKRELEAWFLAAAASLAGQRGLPKDLLPPEDPEAIADCKGWLGTRMPHGYSETVDQPAIAQLFDLEKAAQCPSFAKLDRDLRRLAGSVPR